MQAAHHSNFAGWVFFLMPNQQCQSTGISKTERATHGKKPKHLNQNKTQPKQSLFAKYNIQQQAKLVTGTHTPHVTKFII